MPHSSLLGSCTPRGRELEKHRPEANYELLSLHNPSTQHQSESAQNTSFRFFCGWRLIAFFVEARHQLEPCPIRFFHVSFFAEALHQLEPCPVQSRHLLAH